MEYNQQQIRELLDLYLEGETTLEQEQILGKFFAEVADVPQDMLYAKAMFEGFHTIATQECGTIEQPKKRLTPLRRNLLRIGSAAAVAATIAVTTLLLNRDQPTVYCYIDGKPITDAQVAMEYTSQALAMLSNSIQTPTQHLKPLSEINRSFECLKYLSVNRTEREEKH